MPRTIVPYAYPADVQPFEQYRMAAHAGPGFNGFAGWAEFVDGVHPHPVPGYLLRRGVILVVHFWPWVEGARIEWQPDGTPICVAGEDDPPRVKRPVPTPLSDLVPVPAAPATDLGGVHALPPKPGRGRKRQAG